MLPACRSPIYKKLSITALRFEYEIKLTMKCPDDTFEGGKMEDLINWSENKVMQIAFWALQPCREEKSISNSC